MIILKNAIKYYYGLDVSKIISSNGNYYMIINNMNYMLYKCNLEDINNISLNNYHTLIPTINNVKYIIFDNNYYVLLKLNTVIKKMQFSDLMNSISYYGIGEVNWVNLWCTHIDYIENTILNNYSKYGDLSNTVSYYIGLGENAIELLNISNIKNIDKYITHKRVKYNMDLTELYNPLLIVIDTRVRDIAEYIKSEFFYGDINYNDIYNQILSFNLNNDEYILLFSRLLYPSYFFDLCDDAINGKYDMNKFNIIVGKVDEYEKFLKWIYLKIKKTTYIYDIDWLI